MAENHQKWPKLVQNIKKWQKIIKNMAKNGPKYKKWPKK